MVARYTGLNALFAPQARVDHAGFDNAYDVSASSGKITVPANTATFIVNGFARRMSVQSVINHDMVSDVTNYVVADYNNGNPVFDVFTDTALIDRKKVLPYAHIFKRTGSTAIHTQLRPLRAFGEVEDHYERVASSNDCYGVATDALNDLGIDTGLNVELTGGRVWAVNHEYEIVNVTVDTRLFWCLFYNGQWNYTSGKGIASTVLTFEPTQKTISSGAGGLLASGIIQGTKFKTNSTNNPGPFTVVTVNDTTITVTESLIGETRATSITFWPQLDNLHYNDQTNGTNGLGLLNPGEFTCNCIWRGIENEDHMYAMVDATPYATLDAALAAMMPMDLPQLPISHAKLVGKLVIQQGATTAVRHNW